MHRLVNILGRLHRSVGQTMAEYALLVAVIAIVVIVVAALLGGGVSSTLTRGSGHV